MGRGGRWGGEGGVVLFIAIALQTGSSAFRDTGLRFSGQRTSDGLCFERGEAAPSPPLPMSPRSPPAQGAPERTWPCLGGGC